MKLVNVGGVYENTSTKLKQTLHRTRGVWETRNGCSSPQRGAHILDTSCWRCAAPPVDGVLWCIAVFGTSAPLAVDSSQGAISPSFLPCAPFLGRCALCSSSPPFPSIMCPHTKRVLLATRRVRVGCMGVWKGSFLLQ